MKDFSKVAIRLFVIYSIFLFLNSIQYTIGSLISVTQTMDFGNEGILLDFLAAFIPYIVIWVLYGLLLFILWKKAEIISQKITMDTETKGEKSKLKYQDYITIAFIILGMFIIIETIPELLRSLSLFFISKTIYVDESFTQKSNMRQLILFITQLFKIFLGFKLLVSGKTICNYVLRKNEKKSST